MSNIEIAQQIRLRPIAEVARDAGLREDDYESYGTLKAKVTLSAMNTRRNAPLGKLVLVTAISPTPAGEGKTTTSIAPATALRRPRHNAGLAPRAPARPPLLR